MPRKFETAFQWNTKYFFSVLDHKNFAQNFNVGLHLCYCMHTPVTDQPVTWTTSLAILLPAVNVSFQTVMAVMPFKCIFKNIFSPSLQHCWSHCLNKTTGTLAAHYILVVHLWREEGSKEIFSWFQSFPGIWTQLLFSVPQGRKKWETREGSDHHVGQIPVTDAKEVLTLTSVTTRARGFGRWETFMELWNQLTIKTLILLNPVRSMLHAVCYLVASSAATKISLQNFWNPLDPGNTLLLYCLSLCPL